MFPSMTTIGPNFNLGGISGDPRYPNGPHDLAVSSSTGDVFVTNDANTSVSIVDSNKHVDVVSLQTMGGGIPPNSKLHVKATPDGGAIVLVDTPGGFAERDQLFKIGRNAQGALDVSGPCLIPGGDYGKALEIDPQGAVFVADGRTGGLHRVALDASGHLPAQDLGQQTVQLQPGDMKLAFDSSQSRLYVLNQSQGTVKFVSASQESPPLPLGTGNDFDMAVCQKTGAVGIVNQTENSFIRLKSDPTGVRKDVWALPPGGAHKVAAHEGVGALIVVNAADGTVNAYTDNENSPTPPLSFATGVPATNVVVDAQSSNAFVLHTDGSMTVVTPTANLIAVSSTNVPVGTNVFPTIEPGGRQTMGINPIKHEVYLVNEGSATMTCMQETGTDVVSLTGRT